MKRYLQRGLLGLLAIAAITWGFDFVYAKSRSNPYADVQITRYLAVAEKFGKVSYERTDPVVERCVYSLYPQFGYTPCWYLQRHTMRFIAIG